MRLIDELAVPIDAEFSISEFFNEMDLPIAEKEKRKDFAESMKDTMLFIFALFAVMKQNNYTNKEFIVAQLQARYWNISMKYFDGDVKKVQEYTNEFSNEIINTTIAHINEEYFLSDDRAAIIAANEANTILGYSEIQKKIKQGYTRKQWITEKDRKVRKTHQAVDNIAIPIEEYFLVGNSLMMYPHDNISFEVEPKEIVNCRCVVRYLR